MFPLLFVQIVTVLIMLVVFGLMLQSVITKELKPFMIACAILAFLGFMSLMPNFQPTFLVGR